MVFGGDGESFTRVRENINRNLYCHSLVYFFSMKGLKPNKNTLHLSPDFRLFKVDTLNSRACHSDTKTHEQAS